MNKKMKGKDDSPAATAKKRVAKPRARKPKTSHAGRG